MEKTLGLLGDLCCEAEQTWRRMRSVRRCLSQCQDVGLQKRLFVEARHHAKRCKEIRQLIHTSPSLINLDSIQLLFLDDSINVNIKVPHKIYIHFNFS